MTIPPPFNTPPTPPLPPTPPSPPPSREQFLASIRRSLGRAAASGSPPGPLQPPRADESLLRLASAEDDLVELFRRRAQGVGMKVYRQDGASPRDALAKLIRSFGSPCRTVVSVEDPILRTLAEDSARDAAAQLIDWRAAPGLDALYDTELGITDVAAAIAETGTLVVRSSSATSRGGFLVPPAHLALLRTAQIIPDMLDLWPHPSLGATPVTPATTPPPTSLTLITGPSKTADIEGILVTGVHGPREVHILLLD